MVFFSLDENLNIRTHGRSNPALTHTPGQAILLWGRVLASPGSARILHGANLIKQVSSDKLQTFSRVRYGMIFVPVYRKMMEAAR